MQITNLSLEVRTPSTPLVQGVLSATESPARTAPSNMPASGGGASRTYDYSNLARGDILAMLMREAGMLILAGLALGLAGAAAAARLLMSQLFGITPADPLTLALSAGVLLAVAALAGYIPARRAAQVEPLVSLRAE